LTFQRYLESILENVADFGEVKDIISRFDTLAATNQELLDRSKKAQEKTEKDRSEYLARTEVCIIILCCR
jgi:hypothetical protein